MTATPAPEVLIVAGEASGDRMASEIARALGSRAALFGIAGRAARQAGVATAASRDLGVIGVPDVGGIAWPLGKQILGLTRRVRARPPRAAILINYTELSSHLGAWLRSRGVFVLWCVAPQVWAWRAGRVRSLHRSMDRLAVILPFEEALWRSAGVDARYVGHPAWTAGDEPPASRRGGRLAVMPGSRRGEIERLAAPLCEAARRLAASHAVTEAVVVSAPSLQPDARQALAHAAARAGLRVVTPSLDTGAGPLLQDFDASLVASGTASLESALAGAAPIVTYRTDRLTYAVARRLVRTPHVALPNVLLGGRVFPELLQDRASPDRIAAAAAYWLTDTGRRRAQTAQADLHRILRPRTDAGFGASVAALLPL
jgi:lipid-A-disaccharide synthase